MTVASLEMSDEPKIRGKVKYMDSFLYFCKQIVQAYEIEIFN